MTLVSSFGDLVQQLSPAMTAPTFDSFLTLLTGWVFARRRVVTRMIEASGAVGTKHHSSYHRVFSAARWCLDDLGLAVFGLASPWLKNDSVLLSLDDTLARKRGLKVFGAGMHHDPLISSRGMGLVSWGHSWVILCVVVALPFRPGHSFSLPILFRLYTNREGSVRKRCVHRTRPELAVQMLEVLCQRHADKRFAVVADSVYSGQSVLAHLPENCDLIGRLDLDAMLYDAPPARKPGRAGRPRVRGQRLPSPRDMLAQRTRRMTLNIYGRHDRVRVTDRVARVRKVPHRPLRIVAVQPLSGGRTAQAFFSTRDHESAQDILTAYAKRWSIEETFHEIKGHLGFEQPQGWTRRAVERTAPIAPLLYSLIVMWFADHGHRHYHPRSLPWYRTKSCASFADMLNTLRVETTRQEISECRLKGHGSRNIRKLLFRAVEQAA